jgi:UDP:flavonoid glycosyltransferase YjiC (YdhE family)
MSRVLFVTWDGGGNVAPAVVIAEELRRRGDTIRVLGQGQQREYMEGKGFGFAPYSNPGPWTASGSRNAFMNAVGFLRLLAGRSLGRDLLAEVDAHPADLIVVDCLLYGALAAVSTQPIPYAVLVHSLFASVEEKMAGGAPGAVARCVGLNPRKLWAQADSVIVATLEELDRPASKSLKLTYAGPALPQAADRLRAPTTVPATVLVSLSTTYIAGQPKVLQNILDAVGELPVRAVVTTGPAVDPQQLRAPANVDLHRYLPHAEVMPDVSLVVGHGGHSTTMLALAHGIPLVILPLNSAFDQRLIGTRIQEEGAGIALEKSSSPAAIRRAISAALSDDSYAREARRLGKAIQLANGTETISNGLQALAMAGIRPA